MGRPWIRVFGGQIPDGLDFDAAVTQAAEQLRRYGDIALKHGVVVVVETHDDWCDSNRVAALMDKAGHPATAVVWDVHHPWRTTGESPAQTWRTIGHYVQYVHLKDAKGAPGGRSSSRLTGQGNVPVKEALEVLQANNYDGWLTLEWEKRWHPNLAAADEALPAAHRVRPEIHQGMTGPKWRGSARNRTSIAGGPGAGRVLLSLLRKAQGASPPETPPAHPPHGVSCGTTLASASLNPR